MCGAYLHRKAWSRDPCHYPALAVRLLKNHGAQGQGDRWLPSDRAGPLDHLAQAVYQYDPRPVEEAGLRVDHDRRRPRYFVVPPHILSQRNVQPCPEPHHYPCRTLGLPRFVARVGTLLCHHGHDHRDRVAGLLSDHWRPEAHRVDPSSLGPRRNDSRAASRSSSSNSPSLFLSKRSRICFR